MVITMITTEELLYIFYGNLLRLLYTATVYNNGTITGTLANESDRGLLEMGAIAYLCLEGAGVINPDWVGLAEIGLFQESGGREHIEIFQFVPIRPRGVHYETVSSAPLIFGACEEQCLPVVRVPESRWVEAIVSAGGDTGDETAFPNFLEFARPFFDQWKNVISSLSESAHKALCAGLSLKYMKEVERRYPEGYLVLAGPDKGQIWDLQVSNARVVMIDCGARDPATALTHSLSRLLYKAPVLIVGNVPYTETGEYVKIACDGQSYTFLREKK